MLISGEIFTHKILWECCLRLRETARSRTKGARYFQISTMLMAYLTYEAYINFLGDRLAPEIWKQERRLLRGIEDKLKVIQKRCGLSSIEKERRPYSTISQLRELRDFLSHGKTEKYSKITTGYKEIERPLFLSEGKLNTSVSRGKANVAVTDVKKFIEFLHGQVIRHRKDLWFGDEALTGIRSHELRDSKVNE